MFTNLKRSEDELTRKTNVILKDYEKAIIEIIVDAKPDSVDSRNTLGLLQDSGFKISRASVINFLNVLRDQNLVKYTEKSGKGGMAGEYAAFMGDTLKGIYTRICFELMEQMIHEFKEVNLIWCALNLQDPNKLLTKDEAKIIVNSIVNTETNVDLVHRLADKIDWITKLE